MLHTNNAQLLYWSKDKDEHSQDAANHTDRAFVLCDGVTQSFLPEHMSSALATEVLPAMTGGRAVAQGLRAAQCKYKKLTAKMIKKWNSRHPQGLPSHYLHHLRKGKIGAATMIAGQFNKERPLLHVSYRGDCNILILDADMKVYTRAPYGLANFPVAPEVISPSSVAIELHQYTTVLPRIGYVLIATDAMAKFLLAKQRDPEFLEWLCKCDSLVTFRKQLLTWWKSGLEADDITLLRYQYSYI